MLNINFSNYQTNDQFGSAVANGQEIPEYETVFSLSSFRHFVQSIRLRCKKMRNTHTQPTQCYFQMHSRITEAIYNYGPLQLF